MEPVVIETPVVMTMEKVEAVAVAVTVVVSVGMI
jgi:hypothetical protein